MSEINTDLLHWGAQAAVLRHYGREHPPPLAVVQGEGRVAVENIVNRGPDELRERWRADRDRQNGGDDRQRARRQRCRKQSEADLDE